MGHCQHLLAVRRHAQTLRTRGRGFTLIELMVAVAIVAILAAYAVPSYSEQVLRGRLTDAAGSLTVLQMRMEQYYQDNRSYLGGPCAGTTRVGSFSVTCSSLSAQDYTITAQGTGSTDGFVYAIDSRGQPRTIALPARWGSVPSGGYGCWVMRRGETC